MVLNKTRRISVETIHNNLIGLIDSSLKAAFALGQQDERYAIITHLESYADYNQRPESNDCCDGRHYELLDEIMRGYHRRTTA